MSPITFIDGTLYIDGLPYEPARTAAPIVGITVDHLSRLAKAGKVPARRVSQKWYFNLDAIRSTRLGRIDGHRA
jgi:hypothetical protein